MKELYPDIIEELEAKFPKPKSKEFATANISDAGLGDQTTQGRKDSGILTFIRCTPVTCMSR